MDTRLLLRNYQYIPHKDKQTLALVTGEPKQLSTYQYQAAATQTEGTKQSKTTHKGQSKETAQLQTVDVPRPPPYGVTQTTNTTADGTLADQAPPNPRPHENTWRRPRLA